MGPSPTTDAERRDRYRSLAELVGDPVARYLGRRADPDEAEDAWSETMTVLWRRLDDVPADAEIAWSIGVARRTLANRRRSTRRRLALVERLTQRAGGAPVAGLDGRAVATFTPRSASGAPRTAAAGAAALSASSTAAEHDEPHAELHAALDRLGPDDRELLRLWAWEDLTPSELAVVLDVTPNAVSIRLHRARKRLEALLTPDEPDGATGDRGKEAAPAEHRSSGRPEEDRR